MPPGNPNMKPGAPSLNPGGRSREQRTAARQQASFIQKMTRNGQLTAEFAGAILLAGAVADPEDPDGDVVVKLAEKNLRRFGVAPSDVTLEDKKWASKYLDDRGLGKPEVSIDVTTDGQAVGTVSLIPVDLGTLTDDQLADMRRRIEGALPPADDGGGVPG